MQPIYSLYTAYIQPIYLHYCRNAFAPPLARYHGAGSCLPKSARRESDAMPCAPSQAHTRRRAHAKRERGSRAHMRLLTHWHALTLDARAGGQRLLIAAAADRARAVHLAKDVPQHLRRRAAGLRVGRGIRAWTRRLVGRPAPGCPEPWPLASHATPLWPRNLKPRASSRGRMGESAWVRGQRALRSGMQRWLRPRSHETSLPPACCVVPSLCARGRWWTTASHLARDALVQRGTARGGT